EFLQQHYRNNQSLESAFTNTLAEDAPTIQTALSGFHNYFFSLKDAPQRTRKHVATPDRKSSCKRLNMFLRWMVRKDNQGIDFGLWSNINPSQLMIPLDVHVQRIATKLGLLTRKQTDWKAVEELTDVLRAMNPEDPVKYDFALFGLGVLEEEPFEQVVAAFL
ncbi:MAG: TIGR02757 family protein, partial [Bacteroidota bacterium]